MSTVEWARKYRRLSPKSTARPGRYNPDLTPWVYGMLAALDDPAVWKVVCRKSAQVAWTDGVLLNYIGRRIHLDPCPIIVMFAKEGGGTKFDREKLTPMIEVTPVLAELVPVHKSRDRDNGRDHKGFPGGFLNLVGSNSPDSVKSTPAPVVAVEEPDDSNTNVKGQGDTITLLEERTKTYAKRKVIFGGTPTIEGFSRVDEAYQGSDKREFWVPCPDCHEPQTLTWERVQWQEDPAQQHKVFGHALPSTARYVCAHCGSLWDDKAKFAAVRRARELESLGTPGVGWVASAAFHGVAGFAVNELYSGFPGSALRLLVEKYLTAEHELSRGDDTKKRSFVNNTKGLPYAYKSTAPSVDVLRERAESYQELTVPWGGLVLTAGVDVQHDRLAVVIRAWGRGEESWLVWWGEIHGRTMLVAWNADGSLDTKQSGAWGDLDQLLTGGFPHASGTRLRVRAASFDSSDGQTQDAVYSYVRRRLSRGFLAIKGENHDPKKDIFSPPKLSTDTNARHKPHPSGIRPYMVGVNVAKDLILGVDEQGGRIKLQGNGPGRMHWYDTVRPDYYDQITAEVKVPHPTVRGRLIWQCKSGRRNEGLDCEVYALHAARSMKLNLWRDDRWSAEEAAIKQPALGFEEDQAAPVVPPQSAPLAATDDEDNPAPAAVQTPAPTVQVPARRPASPAGMPKKGGWSAKKW